MVQNRNTWEESSELFHARKDNESPRHDVGGAINDLLTEETEQDYPNRVAVIDGKETGADVSAEDHSIAIEVGQDVIGSCGHKIGEVVDVLPDHLVVEKGFFVPEDVYIPKSAIVKGDEHHLTINVSRETSEHSGWEQDPEDTDGSR